MNLVTASKRSRIPENQVCYHRGQRSGSYSLHHIHVLLIQTSDSESPLCFVFVLISGTRDYLKYVINSLKLWISWRLLQPIRRLVGTSLNSAGLRWRAWTLQTEYSQTMQYSLGFMYVKLMLKLHYRHLWLHWTIRPEHLSSILPSEEEETSAMLTWPVGLCFHGYKSNKSRSLWAKWEERSVWCCWLLALLSSGATMSV